MAKTRKPRPSFEALPPPAAPVEPVGWAYRSDAPAEASTALARRGIPAVEAQPVPGVQVRPTPGWVKALTTPLAIGMVIGLAPLAWWRRR